MRTIAFWLSLIVIFTIPWEEMFLVPGLGTPGRIMGLVLAAFWLLAVISTGKIRTPGPFHFVFLLFILWHVLSTLWTIDPALTLGRLSAYIQLIGLVYIIWDLYTTPAAVKRGLQAYILGAYVSVGSLLGNFVAGNETLTGRFTATGFDPNNIGVILALGVVPAWHLATSDGQGRLAFLFRTINYLYLPAAALAVLLTGSRGALIAIAAAGSYVILNVTRLRPAARNLAVVLLLLALFLVPSVLPSETLGRLATVDESIADRDLNGRFAIWLEGIDAFAERPLLGAGSSAFRAAVGSGKVAHNSFLSVLVEVGLVGFTLFAILLAMTIVQAARLPKPESRLWLAIMAVLFIGVLSLNWAQRKQFWLFPSLLVASANVAVYSRPAVKLPPVPSSQPAQ